MRKIKITGGPGTGQPIDANNNAEDFLFVSTTGGAFGGSVASVLGVPGAENLSSPINSNAQIRATLVDPLQPQSSAPNRVRNLTPVVNGPDGTLSVRRSYTNLTGKAVTRLRFRVVDITTLNTAGYVPCNPGAACPQADLRVLSSDDVTITRLDNSSVQVRGLTLEETAAQALGGGLNSTLRAGSITLETPLPAGQSISVQFVLGVYQRGNFRFLVNVEAQP